MVDVQLRRRMPLMKQHAYGIELSGVPMEFQDLAERDIRMLVRLVASVAKESGVPFMLGLVRVTDSFQDDVNQLLQGCPESTGYIAIRDNVQAYGKTMWTGSSAEETGFAVLVDATFLNPWSLNNPACLPTLLHELFHVIQESIRLERLGYEEYFASADTAERLLDAWANRVVDEFDIDRLVDRTIQAVATGGDGQRLSLLELHEALNVDWVGGLTDVFNKAPRFVDECVRRYMIRGIDIDRLASELIPYINDVIILLVHTASLYMGTDRWADIRSDIEDTECYRRFFGEHGASMLRQLHDDRGTFEDRHEIAREALESVFRHCGLSFKTMPEGLYIGVAAPSP